MYCQKCGYDLPDNTDVCPVCGTLTRRAVLVRHKPMKLCIRWVDILSMLMTAVFALFWGTGSHYIQKHTTDIFTERGLRYDLHPGLLTVDILFAVLLVSVVVFSVMTRYSLMRERRIGLILLPITLLLTLAWGILYPLLTQAATGIISPYMTFCIIQAVVYAVLVLAPAVVIFRSDQFIY